MGPRISILWWPLLTLFSPVLLPKLLYRNRSFKTETVHARAVNGERIKMASRLDLPELDKFDLKVIVEHKAKPGYLHAPGVSYLFKTNKGSLLFDVGYGPENKVFATNAKQLDFSLDRVDALAISHLHPDHMGGFKAVRKRKVSLPSEFQAQTEKSCFLPEQAQADNFKVHVVSKPSLLAAGIGSTGPLARSLFLMGWTEEQALIARIKDKGLVIFTGCGHPTIQTIVEMARKVSSEKIYAIGGGLHFPVTDSPLKKPGLRVQMIWGTGKPPWQKITRSDLNNTIDFINTIGPQHVFLSPHDTCEYSLREFSERLKSKTTILQAGGTYHF